MTASIREQILARVLAALTNTTGAGPNVFRSRSESFTRDIAPSIQIKPDREDDAVFSGGNVDQHELIVSVEIYIRGDPWDSLADPVAVATHRILMADAALQALITRIRKIASKWDDAEADQTAGVLTMQYRINYLTKASDVSDATIF